MSAPGSTDQVQIYYFLALVAIVLVLRLRRSINGQRFSERIFVLPLIYVLILLSFVFDLTIYEVLVSISLAAVAVPLGTRASENAEFFYRGTILYFKRSVLLTIIWLGGFIVRAFLEIFYTTTDNLVTFIVTALLFFTLGLIIGERFTIYTKGKEILKTGKIPSKDEIQPAFEDTS